MDETNSSDVVRRLAAEIPAQIAFRTPTGTWTIDELDQESNRIAQGLQSLGIGPRDRVACLTRHIAECAMLVLGANKIGAVCLPINWRLASEEIEYILRHGEARFLLVDEEFVHLVSPRARDDLKCMLVTDRMQGGGGFAGWRARFDPVDPGHKPTPDETMLQLYSSGTTGFPKGIELTYRNLMAGMATHRAAYRYVTGRSVTFHALPLFHVGGMAIMLTALCSGVETVGHPEFNARRVVEAFTTHRITHTFLVPAMIHQVLQVPDVASGDYTSLEVMAYGAAPITDTVLLEAMGVFQCDFVQNYGLTESVGTIACLQPWDHDPGGPRAGLLRSAGQPADGVKLRIVDAATGQDLPEGEVGEIWIHAAQGMKGYWRNEQATQEAYPEGKEDGIGWLRSGDAGYLRDGYLFIQDRIKDLIISGGENVYPAEVENVLMKHPAVSDCAVIAVPDEKWGEAVKACVVLKPNAPATSQEIIEFMRGRIAHFKCPKSVDFFDAIPRNPSGKILKKVLREPYWKEAARMIN